MSDRGIINNRKASVTFTVEIDGVRRDIVIKPGANRLSAAQYAALQNHPLFRKMFEPIDAVERMSVPDKNNPGEMVEQVTRKRLPPKFREESLGNIDPAEVKDHTGGEKSVSSAGESSSADGTGGKVTPKGR